MNFFNPSNHIKQLWAVCHKIPECSSMKVNSTPARPAFQRDAEVWQHPGPASWTVHSQWLVVQCSSLSDDTTHKKHKPPGRACSSLSVWLVCLMWCWELPGIIKFFARIFFDIKYGIVCLLASRPLCAAAKYCVCSWWKWMGWVVGSAMGCMRQKSIFCFVEVVPPDP